MSHDNIYIRFVLKGGPTDGFEEYLPINIREVCGYILPPIPDSDGEIGGLHGFDEEMPCVMPIPDFLDCLGDHSPDYPVGLYRKFKAYPGELVYVGPWRQL